MNIDIMIQVLKGQKKQGVQEVVVQTAAGVGYIIAMRIEEREGQQPFGVIAAAHLQPEVEERFRNASVDDHWVEIDLDEL